MFYQSKVPERLLQSGHGNAAKRRTPAERSTAQDLTIRSPSHAEAQSGATALHDRLVPVRHDANPALGHTSPRMGSLPVRGHPNHIQSGAGDSGRQLSTAQGAQVLPGIVRDSGGVA